MKTATIRAKSDDVTEVLLYDDIGEGFFGGISAKTFAEQLKEVKAKVINLRINSSGGAVFEGFAMYESLKRHKARIEVDIDSIAASAASVVAMAGDEIRIADGAFVMIHDPWAGVMGTAEDMRQQADLLDKVRDQIITAYQKRTKNSAKQLADWMAAETWFAGAEAVEAGFADKVNEHQRAAAAHLGKIAANFRRVPDAVKNPPVDEAAWEETRKRRALAALLVSP